MIEALEASALAQHLRASRWTYPLVNAGHILGIALLVGAVVPLDVAALQGRRATARFLRRFTVAGLVLAAGCGGLLFITQASDYLASGWFRAKMALLVLALLNAAWHLRAPMPPRQAAVASLVLWPCVLICGRMIGYS